MIEIRIRGVVFVFGLILDVIGILFVDVLVARGVIHLNIVVVTLDVIAIISGVVVVICDVSFNVVVIHNVFCGDVVVIDGVFRCVWIVDVVVVIVLRGDAGVILVRFGISLWLAVVWMRSLGSNL